MDLTIYVSNVTVYLEDIYQMEIAISALAMQIILMAHANA